MRDISGGIFSKSGVQQSTDATTGPERASHLDRSFLLVGAKQTDSQERGNGKAAVLLLVLLVALRFAKPALRVCVNAGARN